jgi:phenylacetic acid degradation protein
MHSAPGGFFSFEGLVPAVDPAAFVHSSATLIGDVLVGARCYVGPGAVLRGDLSRIVMAPGSNLQDNCIIHSFPAVDVLIEEDGHVGHGAVLHGCTVKRNALVGINAIVMDRAVIGEAAMVGAGSFVKPGFAAPPRTLVAGVPARVIRRLSDADVAGKEWGTRLYHELAARSLATLRRCEPLAAPEADRPRLPPPFAGAP